MKHLNRDDGCAAVRPHLQLAPPPTRRSGRPHLAGWPPAGWGDVSVGGSSDLGLLSNQLTQMCLTRNTSVFQNKRQNVEEVRVPEAFPVSHHFCKVGFF